MKVTLKNPERSQRGFTLLEVLVALSIIAISLVVLLQSQSSNIARVYDSTALIKAALLSQDILSDMDARKELDTGEWEGEEERENITFFWKKSIEPSVVESMVHVTISVAWGKKGKNVPYVVETYRAI